MCPRTTVSLRPPRISLANSLPLIAQRLDESRVNSNNKIIKLCGGICNHNTNTLGLVTCFFNITDPMIDNAPIMLSLARNTIGISPGVPSLNHSLYSCIAYCLMQKKKKTVTYKVEIGKEAIACT